MIRALACIAALGGCARVPPIEAHAVWFRINPFCIMRCEAILETNAPIAAGHMNTEKP